MDQIYRMVNPSEAHDLQSMFPDIKVDYTQFKVYSDNYTQSTKNTADTLNDTRLEVYIPPKNTIIKHWQIDAKVEMINNQGAVVAVGNSADSSMIPHHLPSTIERFYYLHGNSSGEILYEITNHAHAQLDMNLQGMENCEEYGQFIASRNVNEEGIITNGVLGDTVQVMAPAADTNFLNEYQQQVCLVAKERAKKY